MVRKGKEVAFASTTLRARSTRNSNRGREGESHMSTLSVFQGRNRSCMIELKNSTHVFLRGQWISFSEEDICRYLGIPYELPPLGEDDIYKKTVNEEKAGNLDMIAVFQVIGKEGMNWANDPWDTSIPRKLDNAILNAQATTHNKLIMANIDPKMHDTTFLMEHALLIYVLMTEGVVNLPRNMQDVMLKRPTGNSRHLLPYPIFVSRLAA
ncbi:hypothetical protein PIB30_073784 [Stylosanthes scabra]|uniref:Putative plant transposon protein domain-containing protein n=1 Tax=Stylosanthes scabra TaxID=79078 RepID=A0ABU6YQA1_9FABA|nr:hypothetical protein [Stylosanthes scabra]